VFGEYTKEVRGWMQITGAFLWIWSCELRFDTPFHPLVAPIKKLAALNAVVECLRYAAVLAASCEDASMISTMIVFDTCSLAVNATALSIRT
jgi:hypothetical protein